MTSKPPDAFLSYTRFDDQHDGGAITEFCRRLASAVRAVTGVSFEIFQDVEGIGIGEHWPGMLDEMLSEKRFFIPMVTPSYFTSKPCREELEKFLRAEAARGRNDLVLPIYYIESEVLEDEALRVADPLASTLHERQRQDWRDLRFEPFEDGNVRRALERLAREIVKARRRSISGRAHAELQQPKENEQSAARQLRAQAERNRALLRGALPIGLADLLTPPSIAEVLSREVQRTTSPKQIDKLLEVGTAFRDIGMPTCPELVLIPPGNFMMGSTEAEREWAVAQGAQRHWVEWEKPQHAVRIAYPLAVGRYPVTFEEYGPFVRTTGHAQPSDGGWGQGRRPVINVGWDDAQAYLEWLSLHTGQRYRLLSEAEWEYACRAGTLTRYWWGDEIGPEHANYGNNVGKTSQVGEYLANPFALYDMHGNVWEWVEDRWHDSYNGAPDDGSAWITGNDPRRTLRGGSWSRNKGGGRAASRTGNKTEYRKNNVGFRVARTVSIDENNILLIQGGSKSGVR